MKGEDPVNLTKRSVAQMTSQILDAKTHSHFSLRLQTIARETRQVPAERQVTHPSLTNLKVVSFLLTLAKVCHYG